MNSSLAGLRIDVPLQALRADLFHHALHRRVDAADGDVAGLQVRRQHAVPGVLDRVHHPVGADGDDAADRRQRHHALAEPAVGIGDHGLDDVAAEVAILRAARRDRHAGVDGPDDLVGGRLDLLPLEEIVAVPVAGEVEHAAALRLEGAGNREQHGVAETAAGQQHRLVSGISVGVPVGPITTTGSPGLQVRAQAARPPISSMISESRPCVGSTQAPVSAMPSISSAASDRRCARARLPRSKFCRR